MLHIMSENIYNSSSQLLKTNKFFENSFQNIEKAVTSEQTSYPEL